MYPASQVDKATLILCFLDFKLISTLPILIMNPVPVIDFPSDVEKKKKPSHDVYITFG